MTKERIVVIRKWCEAYINKQSSPALFATRCIGYISELLDALEDTTDSRDHWKGRADEAERDRYHWKARAEALEKAIKGRCEFCTWLKVLYGEDCCLNPAFENLDTEPCTKQSSGWVFDEIRFATEASYD